MNSDSDLKQMWLWCKVTPTSELNLSNLTNISDPKGLERKVDGIEAGQNVSSNAIIQLYIFSWMKIMSDKGWGDIWCDHTYVGVNIPPWPRPAQTRVENIQMISF